MIRKKSPELKPTVKNIIEKNKSQTSFRKLSVKTQFCQNKFKTIFYGFLI